MSIFRKQKIRKRLCLSFSYINSYVYEKETRDKLQEKLKKILKDFDKQKKFISNKTSIYLLKRVNCLVEELKFYNSITLGKEGVEREILNDLNSIHLLLLWTEKLVNR